MEFSQLIQVLVSFVFVIGLMLFIGYLVKRLGLEKKWQVFQSASGLLTVEDTMFLDPKRRLMVVAMEQKRYVLLLDQQQAQVIDTLPAATKGNTP